MTLVALDREARQRAVQPTGSCIVQAPAGSGKTTLLTMRYLRLLADVERPEQIVAITFTRKAAAEMRHRIVAALELAGEPLPADADERTRELHRHASAALARSRELGWGLEQNPARLHVQTIDGLNHWLARRLPLAARIGTSAALVDDARTLYAEAAERTIARLDEAIAGRGRPPAPRARGQSRAAPARDAHRRHAGRARAVAAEAAAAGCGRARCATEIDRLLRQALESELAAASAALSGHRLARLVRDLPAGGCGRRAGESRARCSRPMRTCRRRRPRPRRPGVRSRTCC